MTPASPPSLPPIDVPEPESPLSAETALARAGWKLRFAPALEAAYTRDTGSRRSLRLVLGTVVGAASFFCITLNDTERLLLHGGLLLALRWLTLLVSAVPAGATLSKRRPIPVWQAQACTALASVLVSTYAGVVASFAFDDLSLIELGGLFLVFMFNGIVVRQQFRWAVAVSLYNIIAFWLGAASRPAALDLVTDANMALFGIALAFTLIANFAIEFRERRTYLLLRLDEHRRAALRSSAEALQRLSLQDALTGLPNRRHFGAELTRIWRAAAAGADPGAGAASGAVSGSVAVAQVDIDWFKRYNDHYGHPEGDRCLIQVAGALREVAEQQGGLAARTGGEEFTLAWPTPDPLRAAAGAEAVCAAVRALGVPHAASPIGQVTVSVGVATATAQPRADTTALLKAADVSLYEAKALGRDRSVAAGPLSLSAGASVTSPPPAAGETTAAEGEPSTAAIDRLRRLLASSRLGLRFPADLEAEYGERDAGRRKRWLLMLGAAGVAATLCYFWWLSPLFADVAEQARRGSLAWAALSFVPSLVSASLRLRRWQREVLFSLGAVVLGVGFASLIAPSRLITVHTYSLAFFLVPMFCTVIAAQPFRISLLPSVTVCFAAAWMLCPGRGSAAWPVWLLATGLNMNALLYSLVGGYLLDWNLRREYLLKRLGAAEGELLRRNAAVLQRLAATDPLTGMPNRRQFQADLARLETLCQAQRGPLALLLIDIDHFKRYNDGYGHPAGDACLARVGAALTDWVAASAERRCAAARIGGEEFAVLLPNHDLPSAMIVAESLCSLVRQLNVEHRYAPSSGGLTASIGAASLSTVGPGSGRRLLHDADDALYRAKRSGRDQVSD